MKCIIRKRKTSSHVERHCGVADAPELEADEESAVVPGHYTEESPHSCIVHCLCLLGRCRLPQHPVSPRSAACFGYLASSARSAYSTGHPPAVRPQISAPSACSRPSAAWLPGVWSVARASAQVRRLPSRLGRGQQLLAVRSGAKGGMANGATGKWRF